MTKTPEEFFCQTCDGYTEVRDGECVMCGEPVPPRRLSGADLDAANDYGFSKTDEGICCGHCGAEFKDRGNSRGVDGPVQRGHAERCPVEPRYFRAPAVCFR
jgi:hypothetical protein